MGITNLIVSGKLTKCDRCGGNLTDCGEIKDKKGKRKKVYRCLECGHRIRDK